MSEWEAVIGLEVHAQLNTNSKLFSRDAKEQRWSRSGGMKDTPVTEPAQEVKSPYHQVVPEEAKPVVPETQ
mgnify:CR=1 FL=1